MTFGGDWNRLVNTLGPGFGQRLTDAAGTELNAVGRLTVRVACRMIRSKQYAPNSLKTIALKHNSTTPLIDKGDLIGSIRHALEGGQAMGVIVGANRTDAKGGNIARKLSEGVRRKGGGWLIPPRPFLAKPANDPEVQKALRGAALRSVRRAVGGKP